MARSNAAGRGERRTKKKWGKIDEPPCDTGADRFIEPDNSHECPPDHRKTPRGRRQALYENDFAMAATRSAFPYSRESSFCENGILWKSRPEFKKRQHEAKKCSLFGPTANRVGGYVAHRRDRSPEPSPVSCCDERGFGRDFSAYDQPRRSYFVLQVPERGFCDPGSACWYDRSICHCFSRHHAQNHNRGNRATRASDASSGGRGKSNLG